MLNVIEELTMDEYISLVMANKVKKDKVYRIYAKEQTDGEHE